MTEIENILKEYSIKFNKDMEKYFPQSDLVKHRAFRAMHYSISNGGKRIRPFLVHQTSNLFDVDYDTALPVAISLEMLHTYSLIHDDLPSMDNDDLRRGKPTCHKAFDEATAVLAGDGLLTYAFEVLNKANILDAKKVELTTKLAQMAGAYNGMIAGQVLDLYVENNSDFSDKESIILDTQALKTGCLLTYPCIAGAILGDALEKDYNHLVKYAQNIGLAFQITDDVLDVIGDEKLMGKTLKKDSAQNKLNFVSIYGIEKAKKMAENLINEAIEEVKPFSNKSNTLILLAKFIIERNH